MAYIGKQPAVAALTASDITDGIVSTAKIADTAITNAKLNADIISADTALGAEPADTDEFLVSDAGTLKRMDYSYIKGGTMAPLFKANKAGDQAIATATWTKFQFNNEVYDPSGVYDNSSNYRFTPAVAGYFFLHASCRVNISADFGSFHINIRKNGSDLAKSNQSNGDYVTCQVSTIDLADADDYYEVFIYHNEGSTENFGADSAWNEFSGYKLIT